MKRIAALLVIAMVCLLGGCSSGYSPQAQKACNQLQKAFNKGDKSDTNPAIC